METEILFTEPLENTHFLGNLLLIVSAFVTLSVSTQNIPTVGKWLTKDQEVVSNL